MFEVDSSHASLSLERIKEFETENSIKLTEMYKKFLLKWSGVKVRPNLFMISEEQGA